MRRTVQAAMDDGTFLTAEVVREGAATGQAGWLLLRLGDLVWWAVPGEYATDERRNEPRP